MPYAVPPANYSDKSDIKDSGMKERGRVLVLPDFDSKVTTEIFRFYIVIECVETLQWKRSIVLFATLC